MKQGSWIGGELMDFRAVGSTIQMLVYRINFANPAADRYSRLALWQVHKTRRELDAALKALNIGAIRDMRVIDRGPSERPVMTEIIGTSGRRTVRALRLRTLLGLRDSQFSFDIERNAQGKVLGMMINGRGWGHGVGMCQIGAYGMALEGATYEEILKKYYKGFNTASLVRFLCSTSSGSFHTLHLPMLCRTHLPDTYRRRDPNRGRRTSYPELLPARSARYQRRTGCRANPVVFAGGGRELHGGRWSQ